MFANAAIPSWVAVRLCNIPRTIAVTNVHNSSTTLICLPATLLMPFRCCSPIWHSCINFHLNVRLILKPVIKHPLSPHSTTESNRVELFHLFSELFCFIKCMFLFYFYFYFHFYLTIFTNEKHALAAPSFRLSYSFTLEDSFLTACRTLVIQWLFHKLNFGLAREAFIRRWVGTRMVQLKIHTIYNSAASSSSSGLANTGGLAGPGSSRPPSAACSMCSSGFTTQVMILHRPSTFFFL